MLENLSQVQNIGWFSLYMYIHIVFKQFLFPDTQIIVFLCVLRFAWSNLSSK